ncbi:ABC transporter ATP-binding protein [Agrobacterium leguminum]|uniref:Spermidine/putrescine import ATP-binding protein PotA n=1 Tax=Agrobacterium deltaense NCPPB 1641 TaxID=1183425 RepID=A0A1S7TIH4_9HYPH|nr:MULTISPECIES: ABC transporter ATP-binding protein [Agrobacterium]WFS65102.1 ABC transporter ATP-binding protein [Agrobacterium leguminum]CVI54350.1 Putative ABC transporter (ATP-binding protein) [Agrobacterium deltaense NCPPB 1641]
MSAITLENIVKRHGALTTVSDVSLDIRQGEFIAFLGPSGCGKTTTLRMIAGLADVSEGRILFGNRDVTAMPPYLRNAGLVFQGYALFPHMTVAQNVAFGLEMRKVDKADTEKRVMDALKLVKLDHLATRRPSQLSGGQQQRVALARAIAYEPDVLLLDEPLSALDAKLRYEVRTDLRRLQSELGLTTIFVTHDQDEALSIADRIVVMSSGRIEQVGTPEEIYDRPATLFVAEFIGATNIFTGSLESTDLFRTGDGMTFAVPAGTRTHASVANMAVRPEHVRLVPVSDTAPDAPSIEVLVEDIVYRGALTEYVLRSASGASVLAHCQNVEGGRSDFKRGDKALASWPASVTMLF